MENIKAKIQELNISDYAGTFACEYQGSSAYVCDAISEFADAQISVYTFDQIEYANEHPASVRDAITEGIALSGRDYFNQYPDNDYEDYQAHLGVAAWFCDAENAIYSESEKCGKLCALYYLLDVTQKNRLSSDVITQVLDEMDYESFDLNDYDRMYELDEIVSNLIDDTIEDLEE